MKKILVLLTVSILMAGLIVGTASASSAPTRFVTESCGSTYIVKGGDSISKIAAKCNITVADILALNPQISNPNLIYTGQVLRLSGSVDYAFTMIDPMYWFYTYWNGTQGNIPAGLKYTASITTYNTTVYVSPTQARPGDVITVSVSGFPANAHIDYQIGEYGQGYSAVYDGVTDANGSASIAFSIPGTAVSGEKWIVRVFTTSQMNTVSGYSRLIYITN
jgi:LysM repeat protein